MICNSNNPKCTVFDHIYEKPSAVRWLTGWFWGRFSHSSPSYSLRNGHILNTAEDYYYYYSWTCLIAQHSAQYFQHHRKRLRLMEFGTVAKREKSLQRILSRSHRRYWRCRRRVWATVLCGVYLKLNRSHAYVRLVSKVATSYLLKGTILFHDCGLQWERRRWRNHQIRSFALTDSLH